MTLRFVVPAGLDRPTGGNRYDLALAAALARLGVAVELVEVPGAWPDAAPAARRALAGHLAGAPVVLVDGLLACGTPDAVAAARAAGAAVHVLVHMPLALDVGLAAAVAADRDARERAALAAAAGVVTTSAWAAAEVRRRHGCPAVTVAGPGADRAPLAAGSSTPLLRQLAAVTPVKDQLTVVAALGILHRDEPALPWTAELTGPLDTDPGYVHRVRTAIDGAALVGRVRLTGALVGGDLDAAWHATDLLLLPSRTETWGLAVTEALARGIPAVVSAGTGAVEALGEAVLAAAPGDPGTGDPGTGDAGTAVLPGAVVPAGDAGALAVAVLHLLGAGRDEARRAAAYRRDRLPGWDATARAVLQATSPRAAATGVPITAGAAR